MKQHFLAAGVSILLSSLVSGQNLVPNPGFESQANCPSNNIFTAADWYSPNTASPDYFHPCGSGSTVPPNVLFGPQAPHNGSSFAGIGWYGLGGGWYDYIQAQLTSPLVAGTVYSVGMWVCLADGVAKASDDLGIHLSSTPFKSNNTNLPQGFSVVPTTPVGFGVFTSCTPQIKCQDNNFLSDTVNWVLISGTYTAVGGEQAITIGCFEPWTTTGTSVVNTGGNDRCYYFIDDVFVEVFSVPQPPSTPLAIQGASSLCAFSTGVYSVAPVSGATSYSWSLPNGWTGVSLSNTISVTSHSASGTLSVSALNGGGASVPQTLSVQITYIQATTSLVNQSLQTTVPGTYQWVDCDNNYTTAATGSATFTPSISGYYAVIVSQDGCADTSACVSIQLIPQQPGLIVGSATVCAGSPQVYSITPVQDATSYSWTLPNGWTGSSASHSILVTSGVNSGTISVTADNQAGSSPAQSIHIVVNQALANLSLSNGVLQADPADSYSWLDCDASYSVIATGNSSFAPAQSGYYAVAITQNGCADTSACVSIQVIPNQPGLISGSATLCAGSSETYSVAPVQDASSYTWTLPNGWTGSSSSHTILVSSGLNSGTIGVTANNQAGASPVRVITVTVTQANAVVTQSNGVLYAGTADSYTWLDCEAGYSVVASGSQSFAPSQSGHYALAVLQNGCTDTSACIQAEVIISGLRQHDRDLSYRVFPNPAREQLFITSEGSETAVTVIMTDYTGKEVYRAILPAGAASQTEIAVRDMSPGIYLLRLESANKPVLSRKIVVVK
jgi:hypothetical protein